MLQYCVHVYIINAIVYAYRYLIVRVFFFCFFFTYIATATQTENVIQLSSTPALVHTTAMMKPLFDKPSGKRDDDIVDDTKAMDIVTNSA